MENIITNIKYEAVSLIYLYIINQFDLPLKLNEALILI